MSTSVGELILIIGSVRPFDIKLVDDSSPAVAEDLSSADHATFSVKIDVDASTDILLRRVADSNLTIDTTNSKLTCTITQAEADALTAGTYIGQASVRIDGIEWIKTDRFIVKIKPSFSPNTVA